MAADYPHPTRLAQGSGMLICSLLALRRCQHIVSQQGHLGAGRTTLVITHCCESLVALPELLTQHWEKVITGRVTSGDQGTKEMAGTFHLFWMSSQ